MKVSTAQSFLDVSLFSAWVSVVPKLQQEELWSGVGLVRDSLQGNDGYVS